MNNTSLYIVNYFTEEYIYLLIKIIVKSLLVVNPQKNFTILPVHQLLNLENKFFGKNF